MLSGHVRQVDGRSLAAATLTLVDMSGHQAGLTHTLADGSYQLVVPTEGTYLLVTTMGSHRPSASLINLHGHPTAHDVLLLDGRTPADAVGEGNLEGGQTA